MISCEGLTKVFRGVAHVREVTFEAREGEVLGIVGPNGAGKSTTIRMLLGLTRPTRGTATFDGLPFRQLGQPLATVGAVLDDMRLESAMAPRRLLEAQACSNRLPRARVTEVLDGVGLGAVAERPMREFSFGMRKRVGLALALLGSPRHVIVDEPLNGLDPPSIVWLRGLFRQLASDGCVVVVASHVLAEQERICDRVVVMDAGRLVTQGSTADIIQRYAHVTTRVEVAPEDAAALARVAAAVPVRELSTGATVSLPGDHREHLGRLLCADGVPVRDLSVTSSGLEGAFAHLVAAQQEFRMGAERAEPTPPSRRVAVTAGAMTNVHPRRAA